MFLTKNAEKIKTHILCSIPFFEYHALYEIMWKNTIGPGRSQMTIWHTCIASSIPQATNALFEYIILGDFPLQQWLHERTSMLDYTYIARLVHDYLSSP
jgi:hypothetical protein